MKLAKKLGMILLAVWLILAGLQSIIGFSFAGIGVVLGVLALLAGAFILIDR